MWFYLPNKFTIQKGTAFNPRNVRTYHTQELLRIFRNFHKDIPEEEKNQKVSELMKSSKTITQEERLAKKRKIT